MGNDGTPFSNSNTIVKTGIIDGGLFSLDPHSGRYVRLRRDGRNPWLGNEALMIN